MFKTYFSRNNKLWGTHKNFGGTAPKCPPPASTGLIRNGRITSFRGESTNWSRKPNDIPWMLLASLWQSVVVLTMLSWMMDGNSSTPTLSQHSLSRVEWVMGILVSPLLANFVDKWTPLGGRVCIFMGVGRIFSRGGQKRWNLFFTTRNWKNTFFC